MEKWTVTAVNGNIKAKSGNNHPLFIIVSIGLFVFSIAVHSQAARGQTLYSCVLN